MAVTSTVRLREDRRQFQDLFHNIIEMEVVWNPASVASNGEQHENVTVPGARLGDFVWCSIDVDIQDLDLMAHVTAADVVTIGLHNPTAGAVDLGPLNLHMLVLQVSHSH